MRIIDADELELWLKRVGKFLKCEEDSKRVTKIIGKIIDHVNNAPTVEAKPVVKGEWELLCDKYFSTKIPTISRCSVCGKKYNIPHIGYNFCPNCGADMRGRKNE